MNILAQLEQIARAPLGPPAVSAAAVYILDQVHAFLGRFVAYPSEDAHIAHTLWIAHTHLMAIWESTPRLAFLSPEPGSGKTRALELTETLVPRPMQSINATAAAMFRKVSDPKGTPTILFDEIDTIFGPRAKEHEDLRALINAGHRRGAVAHRCVMKGKTVELEEFPAYCAVALAGLGNLPDTILTRSIVINMRRRLPTEQVEPYRRKVHAKEGHRLRDRLAAWIGTLQYLDASPVMPPEVIDRDADVWEPLLCIADAAGGTWPERARVTAVTMVTRSIGEKGSLGLRLLTDLRTVFSDDDKLASTELIERLVALEESPWGDLKGKPLNALRLSRLLSQYGVSSKPCRIGSHVFKGYAKEDFHDPWSRYLPSEDSHIGSSSLGVVTPVTEDTQNLSQAQLPSAPKEAVTEVTEETEVPEPETAGVGLSPTDGVTSVTGDGANQDDIYFEEESDVT